MGYNYGAGKYGRVRQSIRFGCGLTVAYAAAFWALAMAFPGLMIQIFNDEPEVIQAGIPALRIYFALFIPMVPPVCGAGRLCGTGPLQAGCILLSAA